MCEIIRQLRKERNLTLQQVADYLHLHRTTYTYYESGRTKINIDILVKLAHFYKVSYAALIGRPEPVLPDSVIITGSTGTPAG